MPAVNLSIFPTQIFSNGGKPGAGYRIFTYDSGSFSTLKATYTDSTGTVQLPNPIIADSSGRLPQIWFEQGETYNVAMTLPDGTTVVQTWQNLQGVVSVQVVEDLIDAGSFLPLTGGTLTGLLTVNANTVLQTTTVNGTLSVTGPANLGPVTAPSVTASLNANSQRVINVATPTGANDAANKAYVDSTASGSLVPAGSVIYSAGAAAPTGWLVANGSAVSRTTYAALFAVISTTYGAGDGSTTFNLPDLRGVFVRGLDASRGLDPGRALGSLQQGQVQTHKHVVPWGEASAGPFGNTISAGRIGSNATDNDNYWWNSNDGADYDGVLNPAGTVGSETRPVNIALLPLIKT